jgi:hypothetical protein
MGRLLVKQFSPKDLQGLALWLKADAGVTLSGSDVIAWADQSENGNNATPVADNPIYNISDLNSKPTISLTSMSDYVERVFSISINPLGVAGSTAFSVQYVEDVCDAGDDNGPIFGNFGGSEDTFVLAQTHYPYGPDCFVYDAFGTRLRKNSITPPVTITNVWTLYSVKSTDDDWQSFVNGQLMHSDPTNTYSSAIGGDDTTLYIGKQTGAGNFSLKGKVAEVIVYNRVLTTPERQQVEAYLNAKYAIYSPIPNNKISIKKQNLGGGKLTAKLIQSAPPFNPASIAGLQAFWNMEGVPPNNQTDNSGNGRTLVYAVELVDATSVAGKIGNAVSFNATDLPFDMGEGARYYTNSWGVDVENDFSMSVWMKTRNFSSYSHIIGAPFQNGFYIGANETELTFNLFNGTVFGITAPTVAANTWVHYVFIRSGNNLILYANNTLVGSVDITGESFPNASVFSVGGGEFNEYYYDGDIDALGIWNAALTPTDIANLWNAGAGVQIS